LLNPQPATASGIPEPPSIALAGPQGWTGIFRGRPRQQLEEALPAYLRSRPWFQGHLRTIKSATLRDVIPLGSDEDGPRLALVQTDYNEGEPDVYLLPLAFTPRPEGADNACTPPGPVIARLHVRPRTGSEMITGFLYDPSGERGFVAAVLDLYKRQGRCEGEAGELRGLPERVLPLEPPTAELRLLESCNTVVTLGERLLLKLYRRIEEGMQPEMEINRVLLGKTSFAHVPALLGSLAYRSERAEPATLGIVQEYVVNEGDAWRLTLDALRRYFDHILASTSAPNPPQLEAGPRSLVELSEQEIPGQVQELLGSYLETSRLMAQRIGELHVALASVTDDPDFAPEPFTAHYQRSLYQSMRGRIRQTMALLRQRSRHWPEPLAELAGRLTQNEDKVMRLARHILERPIEAQRIRCHGHLHLGHLLYTGKDFLIIDLEGEPDRPLVQRRRKRSPARDLASLHRSLQEAALAALRQGGVRTEDVAMLEPWTRFWQRWAAVVFLKEYRAVPGTAALLPRDPAVLAILLDFYRFGWNMSGLRHELAMLSDRASMLLRNLLQMLERM
jgi:maltose alpha-D-glucosyltransferase/alpha-amylase